MVSVDDTPKIPYEYAKISDYDFKCGTYNLTDFQEPDKIATCPDMYVCEDGIEPQTDYAECVQAMNCHMMSSMTTNAVGRSALFCHQMIPHHQNAVNMAKALLHAHDDIVCAEEGAIEEGAEIAWECELAPILYDIINVQNSQIIEMQGALEQLGESNYENCDVDFSMPSDVTPSRRLAEPDFMKEQVHRETEESAYPSGIDCRPCEGTEGDCDVKVGINLLAGEWGYFIVEGCDGVNPTLHLEVGRTYLFDQSDPSNWYHLIGFAYEADGAHADVPELQPDIAPGNSNCVETLSCPAPMYFKNNTYTGVYSNIDNLVTAKGDVDFGLDAVEPLFFHPQGVWEGYESFVTALNFDDDNFNEDIFYFCHVHSGMTGRIKLIGSDGSMVSEANTPEIPYPYSVVSAFDKECGTFDLEKFQPSMNSQCPESFICYDGAGTIGDMVECVNAMDCAMLTGMTVYYGDEGKNSRENDVILFLREMIPHHQNAVNMAKNLLNSGEVNCSLEGPVEEGAELSTACVLDPIVRSIINAQNSQIQAMRGLLDSFGVEGPEEKQCSAAAGSSSPAFKSLFGVFVALFAGLELLGL